MKRLCARPSVSGGSGRMSLVADMAMFGRTVLVAGPETLLVDRAVDAWKGRVAKEAPDVEIGDVHASELTAAELAELTGGSLFSSQSALIVRDIAELGSDVQEPLVALAMQMPDDVALLVTHLGGNKGSGTVNKLKKLKVEVIDAPAIKPWHLNKFVIDEGRRLGIRLDEQAAEALVAGVGHDPRALSSALVQLISDAGQERLTEDIVKRYFAGRAEVSSFNVVDAVMSGRTGHALEQLRWALETGVAPVLITSALARSLRSQGKYNGARSSGMRGAELASVVGVPPFKLKEVEALARRWNDTRVADGLRLVATADGDIKGQAASSAFTLEKLVLALTQA